MNNSISNWLIISVLIITVFVILMNLATVIISWKYQKGKIKPKKYQKPFFAFRLIIDFYNKIAFVLGIRRFVLPSVRTAITNPYRKDKTGPNDYIDKEYRRAHKRILNYFKSNVKHITDNCYSEQANEICEKRLKSVIRRAIADLDVTGQARKPVIRRLNQNWTNIYEHRGLPTLQGPNDSIYLAFAD